jgi:hypothetical protein
MKQFLILIVVIVIALMIGAYFYNNGTYVTPVPGLDNSAASQNARAAYAMQQAQQLEANAHAAAVNETAQAQAANGVLSIAATATAQALDVARVQLAMTAEAANLSSTQSSVSAQQTAQAVEEKATVDARAMLLAQQQAQATATVQAIFAQQTAKAIEANATAQAMQLEGVTAGQVANASQQQRVLMSWLIPVAAAIVFGLVLLLGSKLISGMIDAANERRSLENQRFALLGTLFKAPTETIIFIDDPPSAQMLNMPENGKVYDASHAPMIDTETPPAIVVLSSGEKMLTDRAEAREEAARCKLAMKLIRDAINHVGAQSNRIPTAAQLGWPAWAWTIAIASLRPYGVEILTGEDGGTYLVGQYPTLQALYIAIGEKRLTLYPPPAESVTDE